MISCKYISHSYPHNRRAIENFSYSFQHATWTTLVGPNGCGKSTLLKLLIGLLPLQTGTIHITQGKIMAYVFQSYKDALFPWMTVMENICYPLIARGMDIQEAHERAHCMLALYMAHTDRKCLPGSLSGGQQQLLNILRAIAASPDILLLDEPFSSLDSYSKQMLYEVLQTIYLERAMTIIMVSHDLQEARYLSQDILLLKPEGLVLDKKIENTTLYPRLL